MAPPSRTCTCTSGSHFIQQKRRKRQNLRADFAVCQHTNFVRPCEVQSFYMKLIWVRFINLWPTSGPWWLGPPFYFIESPPHANGVVMGCLSNNHCFIRIFHHKTRSTIQRTWSFARSHQGRKGPGLGPVAPLFPSPWPEPFAKRHRFGKSTSRWRPSRDGFFPGVSVRLSERVPGVRTHSHSGGVCVFEEEDVLGPGSWGAPWVRNRSERRGRGWS